jgi:hypothetical protein
MLLLPTVSSYVPLMPTCIAGEGRPGASKLSNLWKGLRCMRYGIPKLSWKWGSNLKLRISIWSWVLEKVEVGACVSSPSSATSGLSEMV